MGYTTQGFRLGRPTKEWGEDTSGQARPAAAVVVAAVASVHPSAHYQHTCVELATPAAYLAVALRPTSARPLASLPPGSSCKRPRACEDHGMHARRAAAGR